MPIIEPIANLHYTPPASPLPASPEYAGLGATIGAAFRQENDVWAAWQLLNRPTYTPDPKFDVGAAIKESDLGVNYSAKLARALSQGEFDSISTRIREEKRTREITAGAGWVGMVATIGAGVASPTMFIPLTGGARGLKGAAQAVALAAAAGTFQEGILFAEQETRTVEEFTFGVGAATLLGGLLGSAAAYMPRKAFDKAVSDMVTPPRAEAISITGEDISTPTAKGGSTAEFDGPAAPKPVKQTEYLAGTSKTGDEVVVYSPDGTAQIVTVEEISEAGSVLVRTGDDTTLVLGEKLGISDPRSPDILIESVSGTPRVSELSDAELVNVEARLSEKITALEDAHHEAEGLKRERAATQFEAKRRVDEAKVRSEEPTPVAREGEPAVAARVDEPPVPAVRAEPVPVRQADVAPTALEQVAKRAEALPEPRTIRRDGTIVPRSVGAAQSAHAVRQAVNFEAPNQFVRVINNVLAQVNVVGQAIAQDVFATASYWMSKLDDSGLRMEGNADFIPHAPGGTVTARQDTHGVKTAQFIQAMDDGYARYVFEEFDDPEKLKSAMQAHIRSGLNLLPEGKMTKAEFDEAVFIYGQIDDIHPDPFVRKVVAEQRKLYSYFVDQAEKAFQHRQSIDGSGARRLFDPEGNLGPELIGYVSHKWDASKVVDNSVAFRKLLKENAMELGAQDLRKRWTKWKKADGKLDGEIGDAALNVKQSKALQDSLGAEVKALEADAEYVAHQRQLAEIREDIKGATAEDLPALQERLKDIMAGRSEGVRAVEKARTAVRKRLKRSKEFNKQTKAGKRKAREALEERKHKLREDFEDTARARGAVDVDITKGTGNFTEWGNEAATKLYNSIAGLGDRVSGLEILGGPRGSELARVLNLPFDQKMEFLHTDPEFIARSYAREMAGDIEMYRATGSVNGAQMFSELAEEADGIEKALASAEFEVRRGETVPYTPERKAKALRKLKKKRQKVTSALEIVVQRIRHQRGISKNPDGLWYRFGRAAMNFNVSRLMGGVAVSSAPDVARPVMKMGLMSTLKHSWIPMVTNMQQIKMSREVARGANIGWETVMHNRSQAMFDIWDQHVSQQTKLEKGIEFLANKTGFIAGFDLFTREMKYAATHVTIGVTSEALRHVVEGGTAKQVAKAQRFLAANGVDEAMARNIWAQFNLEGGSTRFDNGAILPNGEKWTDTNAITTYNALLNKVSRDTIVTPGVDRPAFVDETQIGKIFTQFQSFNFTSTSRTMQAGLQDSNMAVANGIALSLAMGGVSYYLWAVAVGGDAEDRMRTASAGEWADEAISRSGLLAIFSMPHEALKRIPATAKMSSFAGQPTTRRAASSLSGLAFGPSYDLLEKIFGVVLELDEPTDATLHKARLMWAYQNAFYLRQTVFDPIEEYFAESLPDRRKPK